MSCRVEILPSAWEDLKQIEDYYALNFDVETALQVSDHILDTIERLQDFPDSGSYTPDIWLNERGYKMVICKKHVAIYRRIQECIYVYHIADTQADLTVLVLEDLTVSEMEGAAHTEVRMAAIRSFILKAAIWMTF